MTSPESHPEAGAAPEPVSTEIVAGGRPVEPATVETAPDEEGVGTPLLYVGIGASAGGLEALKQFFGEMPPGTGMTFIVVQHLAPDHKSMMDELLRRHTRLRVEAVEDGVELRPDTVYLIPPRRNIMLAEGSLFLSESMEEVGVQMQIDIFFKSLASGAGGRSVGVVLSGTGSDGSHGIGFVKDAGGLVLVQEPTSAKFDGMPANAVATGRADFVSAPQELAAFLERFARDPDTPLQVPPLRAQLTTGDRRIDDIFSLLRDHCRIDFSQYGAATIARRLERRMMANQTPDIGAYLVLLRDSPRELKTLAREMLIHVSRFFRDDAAFERFEQEVVAPLAERAKRGEELRVWVAGCATGEEAYSIAILLHEASERIGHALRVRIFATDASADVVAEAGLGQFGPNLKDEISAERLARHFVHEAGVYTVNPAIRRMVVFAQHDVLTDPPFSNVDLISCRNVLIYLQKSVQKKVLAGFHFALRENGYLFLGSAEGIGEFTDHFRTLSSTYRIFARNEVSSPSERLALARSPMPSSPRPAPVRPLLQSYRRREPRGPLDAVKTHLVERFAPTTLVINGELNLVHIYGDAHDYLLPVSTGAVSSKVVSMLVPDLKHVAQTALTQVANGAGPTRCTNIPLKGSTGRSVVELEVRRFDDVDERGACYAMTIVRDETRVSEEDGVTRVDVNEQTLQRIRDLEHELARQRESLQVANEELETSNEELQSTNEELMASNEELQSSNEELQSVNEELITVNGEYQDKLGELTVAQDDVDNALALTSTGIIFLDSRLRIRKFTAIAGRLFNLMANDVMRPLRHISNELDYPNLHEDIERVAEKGIAQEKVVRAGDGALILIALLPYNTSFDDVGREGGGVTIALTDLARRITGDREHHLRALIEHGTSDEPLPAFVPLLTASVLVVSARDEERRRLRSMLAEARTLDVDPIEAGSDEAARHALRERSVDVCLIDLRVGADAVDRLARELVSGVRSVPVIVLSSLSRQALAEHRSGSSAVHFIAEEDLSPLMLELSIRNSIELLQRRLDAAKTAGATDRSATDRPAR